GKLAAAERSPAAAVNGEQGGKEEQGKHDCASRSSSEFSPASNKAGSDSPSAVAAVVAPPPPSPPPPPPPPPAAAPSVPNEFAEDGEEDDDIPAASDLLSKFDSNTTWAEASALSVATSRTAGWSSLVDTSFALSQYPSSYRSTTVAKLDNAGVWSEESQGKNGDLNG
ncbi:unnamed protein product, partial [Ectocarpus fasciculatus]